MLTPLEAIFSPATKERPARFLCPTCNFPLAKIHTDKFSLDHYLKTTFDCYRDENHVYRPGQMRGDNAQDIKKLLAYTRKAQNGELIDDKLERAVEKQSSLRMLLPRGQKRGQAKTITSAKDLPLVLVCPSCKGIERRVKISRCVALE